jgi:DNA-nicking Smr family endonuclease
MKLNDHYLWEGYIQTVCKLPGGSIAPKHGHHSSRQKTVQEPINLPVRHAEVLLMNKIEKRKFNCEAKIDLHCCTKKMVASLLPVFCSRCISFGIRNIVIITGKGEGIIKAEVENWIKSFPSYIICFFPIRDSKNESGSYAVRLRKVY